MKWVKKNIIMIAIITIIVSLPFLFNILLSIDSFYPVIGDEKTWLAFWATYIGAIMSALMVYFTYRSIKRTTNLYQTQWKIDWLNAYRSASAELLVALHKTTIIQISQKISNNDFDGASEMACQMTRNFKKQTFVLLEILERYNDVFNSTDGDEYKEKIKEHLTVFQEKAGEIAQFALICENIAYKEAKGLRDEYLQTLYNMEKDMNEAGYKNIVNFIQKLREGGGLDDGIHDAIVLMQRNFSKYVNDMEYILLDIASKSSKLAYDISMFAFDLRSVDNSVS